MTPDCDNPRAYKYKRKICRCARCANAAYHEQKRHRIRTESADYRPMQSAKDARKIISRLVEFRGFTLAEVAAEVGYNRDTIQDLMNMTRAKYPKTYRRSVRGELMTRLEQLELETRGRQASQSPKKSDLVTCDKSKRAIEALMHQGYEQTWIAAETEKHGKLINNQRLSDIVSGRRPLVHRDTEKQIVQVLSSVGMRPGPSRRARSLAESRDYKPAAYWDDLL